MSTVCFSCVVVYHRSILFLRARLSREGRNEYVSYDS